MVKNLNLSSFSFPFRTFSQIDVVANEKHTIKNCKLKIERLEAEIYKTTQQNGSAISQHENHVGRLKKTRVLENRHNTATVQYNKLLGRFLGISKTIPKIISDDHQASFLGSSGTFLGIIRHFYGIFIGSYAFFF